MKSPTPDRIAVFLTRYTRTIHDSRFTINVSEEQFGSWSNHTNYLSKIYIGTKFVKGSLSLPTVYSSTRKRFSCEYGVAI